MKGDTDFWKGFEGPEAIATKPISNMKYFDYTKAKDIIINAIRENKDCVIKIGLLEDWGNTCGTLYNGSTIDPYMWAYDHSVWATPIIDIDGKEIECYSDKENGSFQDLIQHLLDKLKDKIPTGDAIDVNTLKNNPY